MERNHVTPPNHRIVRLTQRRRKLRMLKTNHESRISPVALAVDGPLTQPQMIEGAHPLDACEFAYYVSRRDPISKLPWLRRWFVRLSYLKCDWTSDYSHHSMGVYTTFDGAHTEAQRRAVLTGDLWQVKRIPVNALLCDEPVQFGEFVIVDPNGEAMGQAHIEYEAVNVADVHRMRLGARGLAEILKDRPALM